MAGTLSDTISVKLRVLLFSLATVLPLASLSAQPAGEAVHLLNTEVFRLHAGDELTSVDDRVQLVEGRLEQLLHAEFVPEELEIRGGEDFADLYYGETVLVRFSKADAAAYDRSPDAVARDAGRALEAFFAELEAQRRNAGPPVEQVDVQTISDLAWEFVLREDVGLILRTSGITLLLLVSLGTVFYLLTRFFNFLYARLEHLEGSFRRSLRVRNVELISAETLHGVFLSSLRTAHLIVSLLTVLIFANFVLGLFPDSQELSVKEYVRGGVYAILITIFAVNLTGAVSRLFRWIRASLPAWQKRLLPDLKFQRMVLLSSQQALAFLQGAVRFLHVLTNLLLAYLYFAAVFGLFQATRDWAGALLTYIAQPLYGAAAAFAAYLPNLFFIIVAVLVTRTIIRVTGLLFNAAGRGRIQIGGFYPEWARPTHRLVSVLLIVFTAVIVFPYLPGADSEAFQGISIFLGFMISLGSSALIANIMAGIVVTYMRPFQVGDRVKIADTVGDVVEKTLLVTRVRTTKNVDITIPNGMVLASHIINYSSSARDPGLLLHTTVTIGYDVPHEKVRDLLIAAARAVPEVRDEPAPFVLQTSLDDYYVSYELNACTEHAGRMAAIYSDIHARILESFHAAGVEIMSPHFYALRDGSPANIPAAHLPKDYSAPPFQVNVQRHGS